MRERRKFKKVFKKEIAHLLETKQARMTELCTLHKLNPSMVARWKKQFKSPLRGEKVESVSRASIEITPEASPRLERRRDSASVLELKAKIADLFLLLEKSKPTHERLWLP